MTQEERAIVMALRVKLAEAQQMLMELTEKDVPPSGSPQPLSGGGPGEER